MPFNDDRLRILLLADAPEEARRILAHLDQANLRTCAHRVATRAEFLRELEAFKPNLVLADCGLPGLPAAEVLRLLRERRPETPLLLVAETQAEEAAVDCLREGAEDCVFKDRLKRLPAAVEKALEKRAAERERELAEQALQRSEEQFRLITENTRDLICLLDPDLQVLYANPAYPAALGHAAGELAGAQFLTWVHPDDTSRLQAALAEARLFREGRAVDLRLRHADGHWQHFESLVSHIFHDNGQPQRVLIVSRDTTERRRTEKEIRKLAAFPRFNPNPVLECAADGTLTYFNEAAVALARTLQKAHPGALLPPNAAHIVRTCLATGQSRQRVDTAMGGRTLSWSFFPIPAHQVVHCYAEDITEQLNLEAQLRQALKMESVGQLAAGLAHDFNNLLTVIQGRTELLREGADQPALVRDCSREILTAAQRAANLTRQLLVFSRKQIMQPRLVDLTELVQNLAPILRTLVGDTIVICKHLAAELPAVHADPGMIEQAVLNLAANARDAMPKGGELLLRTFPVEIDQAYTQTVPEARPGWFVCLSVSDTGHGMTPETLAHIFEPFFTTKEVGKGTGLGLATVYGIVQQHRGWIEVSSEVGQGSTFRLFLPAVSRPAATEDGPRHKATPGGHETILLVEDEPALRELVQEILEKKGYRVLSAPTGAKALALWPEHRETVKLLLTDLMMPEGLSGLELAERLRADNPRLKVIYSSGYSLDLVSPNFASGEGMTFLQKPYDPDTLARTVRECLDS